MPGPIGRQTVTVLDAPLATGDYGSTVRDWDNATRTPVSGCTVDYLSAVETKQAGEQTLTRASLFLPPRAPQVTTSQRVEWDGRVWDVDGVPFHAEAAGPLSGQQATLLEVKGG